MKASSTNVADLTSWLHVEKCSQTHTYPPAEKYVLKWSKDSTQNQAQYNRGEPGKLSWAFCHWGAIPEQNTNTSGTETND